MRKYELRETLDDPFRLADGIEWHPEMCAVCGHHLPTDQFINVEGQFVHSDVRICLALINKGGSKL